jgi:PPM family protein phosphatase
MESDREHLEVGALSETGYTRDENQDRMSGCVVPLGHLYIVADGMGGHKGGALAAQTVVEELQRHIGQAAPVDPADTVIAAAFRAANDAVYKKAHSGDPATEGMGTTAVLLLISGRVAKLAHVGDSRAYLYRNGALSQMTTDHTIVQRMVQAGMLKPDEASDHPQSSVLERAIGSTPTVEIDINSHQLQAGDALLLCSDGLSGYVPDAQIEAVLRNERTIQETTAELVRLALDKGGRDNVTVQLVRYGPRKPAPTIGRTWLTKMLPPSAAPGGGGQAPRKGGGTSLVLPAAAVGVAAVAALVYFRVDGLFSAGLTGLPGSTGSNASQSVAAPSSPERQPPTAGESKPVEAQVPDRPPKTPPAPGVVNDPAEVLRKRLAATEGELAKAQQRISVLEGQIKELKKTPARDTPPGSGAKPGAKQSGATPGGTSATPPGSQESPASQGAAKPNGATPGSPPATPPGPPESSAAPAASQPSAATPGAPPGAQEPVTTEGDPGGRLRQ